MILPQGFTGLTVSGQTLGELESLRQRNGSKEGGLPWRKASTYPMLEMVSQYNFLNEGAESTYYCGPGRVFIGY
jgi:hypothetical protein